MISMSKLKRWVLLRVIIVLFIITPGYASAQPRDSLYVQSFADSLNLQLLFVQKGLLLKAKGPKEQQQYYFTPWYQNYLGFGSFLWNIGFNVLVQFSPKLDNEAFSRFDIQSSVFAKRWLMDFIYQDYQGVIVTQDQFNLNPGPDMVNEDLTNKKIQATLTYLPNGDQYSLRFPVNQGDRQIKNSGTFLLSSDFSFTKLTDVRTILIEEFDPGYMGSPELQELRYYSLNALMGYSATGLLNDFYFHIFGLAGLGFQRQRYRTDRSHEGFAVEPVYDIRGAVGYDNGNWYSGLFLTLDYTRVDIQEWEFITRTSQIRCYLGIRFTQPDFLRRIKPKFLDRLRNSPNIPLPSFLN